MEPDELYTLRAQYWLGHYKLCLEEGRSIARRPMPPHLKLEREEFMLRAHLALGQYDKVKNDANGPNAAPGIKALGLHAEYLSSASAGHSTIISSLQTLLQSSPSTSVQLTASHIFLQHNQTRDALQCVHLGTTMEHLAVSLQIYLKMDRLDLAESQLRLMKQADEDSILTQLSSAYLAIATGRSTAKDAIHYLNSLSEQYGPSPMLLNVTAVGYMTMGNYEGAESALSEAQQEGGSVDTLINLVVCYTQMGKGMDVVGPLLGKLKGEHKEHPFVKGLEMVEGAFEREAGKYAV
mmetsp:Transcript_15049/g.18878  ORF Transcript_15049/g.18878 Transcript_15049/m.18878 type:complete len:294 (+) Transcript_15049:141-1022(+)|eukprot:CAMPEP_0172500548 /NCGR_PEP_ID=MMETSP1066-20121228/139933_1 /TAXON_ID=671091 /ORGANISM="Coscinodiscus wailesii, Strain CCMP2513" /LENGTH=293 /DNA_ID=CAMNT_0013274839 /DNA_START=141 /DNA_END=1022 /DNA_ORIENTATION=+